MTEKDSNSRVAENGSLIDDCYVEELERQFDDWAEFLNNGFGMVSFALALACMSTPAPSLYAGLAMALMIFVRYRGKRIFPSKMRRLRELAKEDPRARIALKSVTRRFLSIGTMIRDYPVFLVGYLMLSMVIIAPVLKDAFPFLGLYM